MNSIIDLRSDTVTRPTAAMRKAMANAEVGDDVYGDDPSVNQLQELAADMLGTEATLFLPSGTQSNLCALLSHCQRGDEYIVGQNAHTYMYEGGGAAVLGSIQPQPLPVCDDGTLNLDTVDASIKPDDPHFAKTTLLCLENTTAGKVLPLDYLATVRKFVNTKNLGLHLDGARLFNASVRLNQPVNEISKHFDSISVCLSKGLCAPVGSLLCGNRDFIANALRWRKMLGGGMRQAGVLAAAGTLALTEQVSHLEQDHRNASKLAESLQDISGLDVDIEALQTNIFFARVTKGTRQELAKKLYDKGILISGRAEYLRFVTHFDFKENQIEHVRAEIANALNPSRAK